MNRRLGWGLFNLALLALVIGGGWFAFAQHQAIIDWWRLSHYTAPTAVVQLAADTTMTQHGRDLFYESNPQIEDRDAFNKNCPNTSSGAGEQGAVLGCYTLQSIYIFNVTDPRLPGVQQVTAAHETLHAAYERLDTTTKNQVNSLLQAELNKRQSDQDLQQVISLYNKTEPGELLNEMHSILGTEYGSLSPELEQYYQQYFTNRGKVVAYAQDYKSVFTASKQRVATYQAQLTALKQQIDADETELSTQATELRAQDQQLTALRSSDTASYNHAVPAYNAKVNAFNQLARTTRGLISQYNAIVVQANNEEALQTDLNYSLNSTYQSMPTQ